jgi:hypothetical protein
MEVREDSMRKLLLVTSAVASLAACHVQSIDVAQPVAAADTFYGALRSGDGRAALAQFDPKFKSQVETWPRLLAGLAQRYSPVTTTKLLQSSLAASGEDPCYLLTYDVNRGPLASREVLFLCSAGGTSPWLIRGHGFTRLDTQQTITGGALPTEVGVSVP